MARPELADIDEWHQLKRHARRFDSDECHLRRLLQKENRLAEYSATGGGLFFDFSRQRIDREGRRLLLQVAAKREAVGQFNDMCRGGIVNTTEKRAALHTAARSFSDSPLMVDGSDVRADLGRVRMQIKEFTQAIHDGRISAPDGARFRDVVVIGIGGSYLGTDFVSRALRFYGDKNMRLHFVANVDIHNFGEVAATIDPQTALWVIISKSYTTAETTANAALAYDYMRAHGLDPRNHVITVTSKGSPGDDPRNPVLASFHMFDYIGGRYSVTSAVGGVPLSLFLGYDRFERFLKGAEEMDIHAMTAPPEKNVPLLAALISIWNNNCLGYAAQAIIPYAAPLSKLAPHVQQLYMESNGKSVTSDGLPLSDDSGVIIFGDQGTNAQHSFFQLAHQGRSFPIEFIGVITPQYQSYTTRSKGVNNHQELWANLLAQPAALANGMDSENKARRFAGNRPSSTILIETLTPENVGRLLAFYEARTVYEAFIWGINPFDQFGVELGKSLADDLRSCMAARDENGDRSVTDNLDPISEFYLETLFSGKL